ncbi:MAG: UDP-N-acetylmuramate--L-alanine ligase [Bacteroidia bacterium]|nr:UDP-N-acetylmuramate--L-alanine ligase [Bacteroidia bacterium]
MNVFEANSVYFLGIGGIGMSALARYFHLLGKEVSGYDRASSVVTDSLEELGVKVFFDLNPDRIRKQEIVIFTPAIKEDNVERAAAIEAKLPMFKRAEILGQISGNYKTIAVAGTHGKTTTSTMLTHVLREAGVDVTAFLGGISSNLKSNFVFGKSEWLVVEADEYDRSFLTLHPSHGIITSLDPDHLDIYGDEDEMKRTYRRFAHQAKEVRVQKDIASFDWQREVESYGEDGDYICKNLRAKGLTTVFDFEAAGTEVKDIALPMPGHHNVMNMSAALSMGVSLGVPMDRLKPAVESFKGIYRRFEVQFHSDSLTFVDDYAHHPSEISAVVKTARHLFPERKLVVLFQPHLFTRTRDFLDGFAEELSKADSCILLPIYPAREKPLPGITATAILEKMSLGKSQLVPKADLIKYIEPELEGEVIVLSLGAGDIDREVPLIKDWMEQKFGGSIE